MATPPDFSVGQVLTSATMNQVGLWRITTCTVGASAGGTAPTASDGVITVGTSNTSITIDNAFSADYLNYRIIFSGIDFSAGANLHAFRVGTTATGYFGAIYVHNYTGSPSQYFNSNNATSSPITMGGTENDTFVTLDIARPFESGRKAWTGMFSATGQQGHFGFTNTTLTTSATQFMLLTLSGTMTGGQIRVYGYRD